MITLVLCGNNFKYELEAVCRIFVGSMKIVTVNGDAVTDDMLADGNGVVFAAMRECEDGNTGLYARVSFAERSSEKTEVLCGKAADNEKECERLLAIAVYKAFCEITERTPAWGILTGIRPVKLVYKYWEKGFSDEETAKALAEKYLVSPKKCEVLLRTAHREKLAVELSGEKSFSLYLAVPFCPTRCKYCSFVSHSVDKAGKLVDEYAELLQQEIRHTGHIAKELGLRLETVYMGGGTPTTFSANQLHSVLSEVQNSFDLSTIREFTVEAGRPDTITADKMAALIDCGVDRISINPQTMNDSVLENIGRRHTAAQTLEAYEIAKRYPFKCVNMDLIAGLPGEDFDSFCKTIDIVTGLEPENITVHTLSIKRAAGMSGEGEELFSGAKGTASQMMDYTYSALADNNYQPYYLYRQKNTLDNLENVGFSREGYDGLYNIYIMAETHTILAVGAGGVTKLCAPDGRIERLFNYKYPYEYNSRFDTVLERKEGVREFYEEYFDKESRSS
ncbi:MAG: coproporphyrinogen dehydrogenase HemZ [Oscillospiraceae bacterium]|nr:coproporphyrinogen dehydrogenase HemZ [Oscillospiraceae bacterium]